MSVVSVARPVRPPSIATSALQVALRVLRKYVRTPGLFVMGIVQPLLFLFSFRYVFGGSMHAGTSSYVEYLVPGYVATLMLFTGSTTAVGVAEDHAEGFTDRLLSLPIARSSLVIGRTLADFATNAWSLVLTTATGFAFGFRLPGSVANALAAAGLCLLYSLVFVVVFIVVGLYSPNGQAAQGISMISFVLAFLSATYVEPSSMPGWLEPFAKYQPITPMVDAVRSTLAGGSHDVVLALVWSAAFIVVFGPVAVLRYRRP